MVNMTHQRRPSEAVGQWETEMKGMMYQRDSKAGPAELSIRQLIPSVVSFHLVGCTSRLDQSSIPLDQLNGRILECSFFWLAANERCMVWMTFPFAPVMIADG